ncbi:MAG: hypothetical protein Hals2KO_16980 [Halioglobus sp.]
MAISLEDHIAIERLMYRYAHCADHKDYSGFKEVFTADAEFEFMGSTVAGIAAIIDMMHNLDQYRITQHLVSNVLYDVEGDSANGETYCHASHLLDSDGCELNIEMGIRYVDKLFRLPAGWRIQQRVFDLLWTRTVHGDA